MADYASGSNLTTSATSQTVLEARRGRRIAFSVTNYGATTAWLMLSDNEPAVVGSGVPVYAGTTVSDSNNDKYKCFQGAITAVDDGAGGATTLSIWERVEL
jgi:hypothetical protein